MNTLTQQLDLGFHGFRLRFSIGLRLTFPSLLISALIPTLFVIFVIITSNLSRLSLGLFKLLSQPSIVKFGCNMGLKTECTSDEENKYSRYFSNTRINKKKNVTKTYFSSTQKKIMKVIEIKKKKDSKTCSKEE
jgi:hypothetical protein